MNPMSLLRDNPIKQSTEPRLSDQELKKETKHEKKVSKRAKKQPKEFKSIGDMIKHVQNDVLESDGGEIMKRRRHQNRVDHSIKKKHPICPECSKVCITVMDEKKSTKSHIIWTNLLKCINCGETYKKEVTK